MIIGSVYIALPEFEGWLHQSSADRGALLALESCPDGARVIVDLGDRLDIDIRGTDPRAVAVLVRAVRTGSLDVVA
jgi:hypothetical protein